MEYTWKILESSVENRCMLIEYSSEGRQTLNVSARLPTAEEPLDMVIEMFAPVPIWEEADRVVLAVEPGLSGVKNTVVDPEPQPTDQEYSANLVMVPVVAL